MAKKRVKKSRARKSMKRKTKRVLTKSNSVIASKRKLKTVGINLVIFLVLCIASVVLSAKITNITAVNLFFLLSWIFGFIAVAFLIVLLILWLMRVMNK